MNTRPYSTSHTVAMTKRCLKIGGEKIKVKLIGPGPPWETQIMELFPSLLLDLDHLYSN